jgi:hypothetical protein
VLGAQVAGGVGPHPDERGVPERDLPGVPGQQVQADRADRRDARVVEDRQPEIVGQEVRRERPEQDEAHEPELLAARAEQPQLVLVASSEIARRAGHQTRRTSRVPNRPYGRTIRISTITT